MSHMVIYRGSDGKPGYHQTDDIHDAVGFVESMRNEQGVEHARIFRLEEVVFQYKPYFRVELADSVVEGGEEQPETAAPAGAKNGAHSLNGGEESSDPGKDEQLETLGSLEPPAESGDRVASTPGLGTDGDSESADDASGSSAGSAAKRGLFGR